MRKNLFILGLVLLLLSCQKNGHDIPLVTFHICAKDFTMESAFSENEPGPLPFHHKLSGGTVKFSAGNHRYEFDTQGTAIDNYAYDLPAGEYQLEINIPDASIHGQQRASFEIPSQMVSVTPQTDTLFIRPTPTCSLFLIADPHDQLNDGALLVETYSIGETYCRPYPLKRDSLSDLYYAYFTPDPYQANPSVTLWLYGGDYCGREGGISTIDCKTGYIYYYTILD